MGVHPQHDVYIREASCNGSPKGRRTFEKRRPQSSFASAAIPSSVSVFIYYLRRYCIHGVEDLHVSVVPYSRALWLQAPKRSIRTHLGR